MGAAWPREKDPEPQSQQLNAAARLTQGVLSQYAFPQKRPKCFLVTTQCAAIEVRAS